MDSELARRADAPRDISDLLRTLADVDGTAGHGYPSASGLGHRGDLTRNIANLADAAHYLCMLHGRHPGVIDHAAMRTAHNDARGWLIQAADGFADERTYLTQIAVAAGPVPSTPRSEEHTSELQSLMRISYAVFCLNKKKNNTT